MSAKPALIACMRRAWRRTPHLTLRGVAYLRGNSALMRSIQWQSRGAVAASALDLGALGARAEPAAAAAAGASAQPAGAHATLDPAAAAANTDANLEAMCAAEQARADERPLQPALEPCALDHDEAGAPASAGGAADEAVGGAGGGGARGGATRRPARPRWGSPRWRCCS